MLHARRRAPIRRIGRDRVAAAGHVQRRRAEEARARGPPAGRGVRRARARRARQLPRCPGQAVARGRAPQVHEDHPLRQPRPRAARRHGDQDRDDRRSRRLDPRRRIRQLPRRPPGEPGQAGEGPRALRGRARPAGGDRRGDATASEDLRDVRAAAQGRREPARVSSCRRTRPRSRFATRRSTSAWPAGVPARRRSPSPAWRCTA